MRFFSNETHFDFIRLRFISLIASGVVIVAGFAGYFLLGLHYGIDFTGGTLVQVRVERESDIQAMRQALSAGGIGAFSLQAFGEEGSKEYLITLAQASDDAAVAGRGPAARVEQTLKEQFPQVQIRRVESVGPKVGAELKEAASEAILFSLVAILIYIWVRFQWRYSIGAIVATAHDVLVVMACFVFTQREISLTVVAAVLTVAGYSVNDTIVIYDRIRENLRKFRKKVITDTINDSINQTLSRTVLTAGTTLFVVAAIYVFGGEIINDFAFALLVGIVVGTYSSVFVAAPLVYMLLQRFPPKLR
jgi:preprotein translocase SecF subunit